MNGQATKLSHKPKRRERLQPGKPFRSIRLQREHTRVEDKSRHSPHEPRIRREVTRERVVGAASRREKRGEGIVAAALAGAGEAITELARMGSATAQVLS